MKYFGLVLLVLLITLHVNCFVNFGGLISFNQPKQLMQLQSLQSYFPSQMTYTQSLNNFNKQTQQAQQSFQSSIYNIKNKFSNNIQSSNQNLKREVKNFVQFSNNNFKKYHSVSQTKYRETVYNKNAKNIKSQNKIKSSYSQGLTFYADYTPEQFKQLVLNPRIVNTPLAIQSLEQILSSLKKSVNQIMNSINLLLEINSKMHDFAVSSNSSINFSTNDSQNYSDQNINYNSVNNAHTENKINTTNKTNIQRLKQQVNSEKIINNTFKFAPSDTIKPSVDWRKQNRTSPVKMQGSCGNCYAFSATGALESAFMIKHNKTKVSYSDQQITDCCGTRGYGCNGCEGGWQWQAFQYIKQHGIVSEQQYPNVSLDQGIVGQCKKIISPSKIINKDKPYIAIQQGNVSALYEAVSKQPVSVGVDAANMQFASSTNTNELFSNCSSEFDDANHAMLIVGYDNQGNWILKNSWSRLWGNEGYIKLKAGNTCGVANFALYPQVI